MVLARARDAVGRARFVPRAIIRREKFALLERAYRATSRARRTRPRRAARRVRRGQLVLASRLRVVSRAQGSLQLDRAGKRGRRKSRSAIRPRSQRARRELADAIEMYGYWQFIAHRQWSEMRAYAASHGAFIGGDLAFSPCRDSAEVWANQDEFDLTRTVGAPPDGFNPKGQRWGLPLPNWNAMRARGIQSAARARASCELALRFAANRSRRRALSNLQFRFRPGRAGKFHAGERRRCSVRQGEEVIRRNQAGGGRDGADRRRSRHRAAVGARIAHAAGRAGIQGDAMGARMGPAATSHFSIPRPIPNFRSRRPGRMTPSR